MARTMYLTDVPQWFKVLVSTPSECFMRSFPTESEAMEYIDEINENTNASARLAEDEPSLIRESHEIYC